MGDGWFIFGKKINVHIYHDKKGPLVSEGLLLSGSGKIKDSFSPVRLLSLENAEVTGRAHTQRIIV